MDSAPTNWCGRRSGNQALQLSRRTDFDLQLIADRFLDAPGPQPSEPPDTKLVATQKPTRPARRPVAENNSLPLGIKLDTQEPQKRLITEVSPAATSHRPIFERLSLAERMPYIKACTAKAEKLIINPWWRRVFCDPKLRGLAGDSILKPPDSDHGLIYFYIVAGRIRYVGQTFRSLHHRMTITQKDGRIGYPRPIKRNLLNAFKGQVLKIETDVVQRPWLDQLERDTIRRLAPTNKLWNQKHNSYFELANYQA